jgi:hypothetical protein
LGLGGEGRGERIGNTAIKAICFRIFYCTIKEEKSQLLKIWQKDEKRTYKYTVTSREKLRCTRR